MPILFYVTMIVEFGVVVLGIIRFRELTPPLRYLVWTIIFWFIAGIVERVMGVFNIRNLWLTQCNTLIGLALFIRIYYYWRISALYGHILIISLIVFTILWIIAKFTFEPFVQSDDYTSSISTIIILGATIFLMIQILKDSVIVLNNDPRFWTSVAFILYSVGTLFIFSLFTLMLNTNREVLLIVYPVNWMLTIMAHLFFARAIWCQVPKWNFQNQKSG
jgi:hypothetical protein